MPRETFRPLYIAFLALLLLLIATVGATFIPLEGWNVWIALGIATTKTLLVAAIFMGLNRSGGVVRLASVTGLVWLTFMLTIVMADYMTRGWGETQARDLQTGQHVTSYDR